MFPRSNSLGILCNHNKILLEENHGRHSKGEGYFYRPLGGTIEFCEKSSDCLIREYKEEINVDINIKQYLGCIENIYEIDGNKAHEITQIYQVEFIEQEYYYQVEFKVKEGSRITVAKWIDYHDLTRKDLVVFPNGIVELIKEHWIEMNK